MRPTSTVAGLGEPAPVEPLRRVSAVDAVQKLAPIAALGTGGDRQAFLNAVVQGACDVVGVDRGVLFLRRDTVSDLFDGVAVAGPTFGDSAADLVCGGEADRLSREIVASRRPIAVQDAAHDPRPVRAAVKRFKTHDLLGVPLIVGARVIGLLYLNQSGRRHTFTAEDLAEIVAYANLSGAALHQFDEAIALRDATIAMKRRLAAVGRVAAIQQRFATWSDSSPDTVDIARLAAALTEKPCGIGTVDHRVVAQETPAGAADLLPRVLEASVATHPEIAASIEAIPAGKSAIISANVSCNLLHRNLVAPVTVGGKTWGYVALMESRTRLTYADQAVVEAAARTLELELRIERRVTEATGGRSASVVRGDRDATALQRRADARPVGLSPPMVVCRAAPRATGAVGDSAALAAAFSRHHEIPAALAFDAADGAVALVVELSPTAPGAAEALRVSSALDAALRELPSDEQYLGTVSTVVYDRDGLHHAYQETEHIARAISALCDDDAVVVVSATTLGVGRLVLGATDRRALERYTTAEITALTADDPSGRLSDLLITLYTFLDASRSPRLTADRMNVHENTVRYRLRRVTELTGLEVATDSQDQLTAQVALLVLRLQGKLPGFDPLGRPTSGATA